MSIKPIRSEEDYEQPKFSYLVNNYMVKLDSFKFLQNKNHQNILIIDINNHYKKLCRIIHGKYKHSSFLSMMNYNASSFHQFYSICKEIMQITNTCIILDFDLIPIFLDNEESPQDKKDIISLFPKRYQKLIKKKYRL